MKRTVSVWMQTCHNSAALWYGRVYEEYDSAVRDDFSPETQKVVPCTITYDDGKRAKKKECK